MELEVESNSHELATGQEFSFVKIISTGGVLLPFILGGQYHLNQFEPYGLEVVVKEHDIIYVYEMADSLSVQTLIQ